MANRKAHLQLVKIHAQDQEGLSESTSTLLFIEHQLYAKQDTNFKHQQLLSSLFMYEENDAQRLRYWAIDTQPVTTGHNSNARGPQDPQMRDLDVQYLRLTRQLLLPWKLRRHVGTMVDGLFVNLLIQPLGLRSASHCAAAS